MQSRNLTLSWLSVFAVLVSLSAAAQDVKPTVAPAPLELRRKPEAISKKEAEQLVEEFDRLVRAAGARIPTPSEMSSALAVLRRQDFASSDEALAQLAQKAQTLYAVHVQIDYPVTGSVVAVGKVVRADGKRMNEEVRLERSREGRTYLQTTTETVIAVLEKLDLQRLPSSLPVVVAPVKPDAPTVERPDPGLPPPAPPLVVFEERSNLLLAGRIVAVGGAALVLGGIIALGLASSDASRITPDDRRYLPAEQVELYRGAKTKETAGEVLIGVGAAVAVGGAAMWLMAGEDAAVNLGVSPSPGGATAVFGGTF